MRVGPPSPANVATRYLQAGVLQAPPAMHTAILEWVYAVVAARAIHGYEEALAIKDPNPARTKALQALREVMGTLRVAPTKWSAYKDVYEAAWIFGHPGTRWDVKLFQKPTPESKALLEQRVTRYLDHLEERLEQEAEGERAQTRRIEENITRLRPYTRPEVTYMGEGDVHKKFPVDLTGWRYGDLRDQVMERGRADAQGMLDFMGPTPKEGLKDLVEQLKQRIETGTGFFDAIHVILKSEPINGARAYWHAMLKQLVIAIPQGAMPYDLADLSETLRHELQHFVQTYMTVAIGGEAHKPTTGLPSRSIRTPDFQQQMSPTHPSYRKDDPAVQRVVQKWRSQGIDPTQINFHSLDDIEFYTVLADAIAAFEKSWGHAQPEMEKDGSREVAVKLFTGVLRWPQQHDYRDSGAWYEATEVLGGYDFIKWFQPNPFFLSLKSHATGKWRKAVGELTAAVL